MGSSRSDKWKPPISYHTNIVRLHLIEAELVTVFRLVAKVSGHAVQES